MFATNASSPAAAYPIFTDVEPDRLAADDAVLRSPREVLTGAWTEYLRRVLPPSPPVEACYSAASA
jgi:hypothetical protein